MFVKAEELMRKIEKEEEQISYDDPDKKIFHLCIVNLVIGYARTALHCKMCQFVPARKILRSFYFYPRCMYILGVF